MKSSSLCFLSVFALSLLVHGCVAGVPLTTVSHVDLSRFSGTWYVIANIPTFIEKDAYNAVESYRLADDGTMETVFTFRQGGFDGSIKTYRPRGFVRDTKTNAEWGMQFLWPFRSEYLITYLADDYSKTVISRNKRDYVWIMARTPRISEAEYQELVALVAAQGYDTSKLQRVPQQ
jgi:apolipoprotein D and lipocalin family protein